MPGAEKLTEHLSARWSPSVFDETHSLAADEIETLLHAAQWAPSAGNAQPWAFFVAERGSTTHQLLVPHLSRGNSGWVPRASVVFIAAAQVAQDENGDGPEWPDYSHYALGIAAGHVVVQATSMGLVTHQFAGFDHGAVASELGVPSYWQVMTGIAVGRHGDASTVDPRDAEREERERVRKPLSEIAFVDRWGTPWGAI